MTRSRVLGGLLLVVASVAPALLATDPSSGASLPGLLACSGKAVHRPTTFVITCADGYTTLSHLHWTSWFTSSATATGRFGLNPCEPTCVASSIHYYPHATVRLTGAVRTTHGILFSHLSVRYVQSGTTRRFSFSWKGDPGFKATTSVQSHESS